MTIFLVSLAAALAAVTVWFLARPLARGTHVESREQYFQLQVVRDRLLAQLNELDVDERDRSMAADTVADERARLEAELAAALKKLDALASAATQTQEEHPRSRRLWRMSVVALALIVPVLAAGFYALNATVPLHRLEQVASVPAGGMPDPEQMVARLERRLQDNPNDIRGWLMLGRSYAVLGRLEDAKLAYDHAYPLMPQNFEPESDDALWFLGLAAYHRGEAKRALDFWGKLLARIPPQSEAADQLTSIMEQARQKGGTQ